MAAGIRTKTRKAQRDIVAAALVREIKSTRHEPWLFPDVHCEYCRAIVLLARRYGFDLANLCREAGRYDLVAERA